MQQYRIALCLMTERYAGNLDDSRSDHEHCAPFRDEAQVKDGLFHDSSGRLRLPCEDFECDDTLLLWMLRRVPDSSS